MPAPGENEKYILAVDHGTSGVKAAVVSARGRLVAFEFERTDTRFLPDGGVEQDPLQWWEALRTAARRLVSKNRVPVRDIAAVCCSSTFSTTVAVDRDGEPLAPAMTWMDGRGAPHVKRLLGGRVRIAGYSPVRLLQWIPRTGGGPALTGKDDIAHVLFWQHERPEVYRRAHMFLGSKDFLNLKLTGRLAASYDSVTLFWITDNRDIHNIRYDDRLIRTLGIHREKFPPLQASTDILGTVTAAFARETGLGPDVKVVMGSPDLQSACVGSGAVRDFEGHIYVGTSSWLLCHVPFKKTDLFHTIASLPSAIPGRYFCANEQDTAGGCLDFLIHNLVFHENELAAGPVPEDVYARLDRIVERVPAGSRGVLFTPWLNGEKTPVEDDRVRGGFHNLSLTTNLDHLVRSVFEGVAFNSRWVLQYVEKFVGRRLDPLNIIGGGAESDAWCRIFADVLQRTVRKVQDPIQANARGAAFIASAALGFLRFDDIPDRIPIARTFEPDPDTRRIYDPLFREFLALYKRNRPVYRRLHRLAEARIL